MIDLEFLRSVEVFNGPEEEKHTEIQDHCREKEFRQNEKLFSEGEDVTCLRIVQKGQVDLRFDLSDRPTSAKNTISSLFKFMTFSWSSLVAPNKYRLSGYSTGGGCKFIKIEREGPLKLFEKDTDIGYAVMSNLATLVGARFHNLHEQAARRRGQDIMGGW